MKNHANSMEEVKANTPLENETETASLHFHDQNSQNFIMFHEFHYPIKDREGAFAVHGSFTPLVFSAWMWQRDSAINDYFGQPDRCGEASKAYCCS